MMSIILILTFAFLGGIHTYWALGGTWGADIVLPTNSNGQTMLQPSPLMTIVVSGGLFIFAAYYMLSAGWVNFHLPRWLQLLAGWGIPSIFLLRAIGDFNYVGLFRKVTDTFGVQLPSAFNCPLGVQLPLAFNCLWRSIAFGVQLPFGRSNCLLSEKMIGLFLLHFVF